METTLAITLEYLLILIKLNPKISKSHLRSSSNENSLTLPSITSYLLSDKGARINLSGKHNEQHDLEFHVSNFITVNRPFNDLLRAETTRREAWKLHAQKNLRKFSTSRKGGKIQETLILFLQPSNSFFFFSLSFFFSLYFFFHPFKTRAKTRVYKSYVKTR